MKRSLMITIAMLAMAAFSVPSFAQTAGPKAGAQQGQQGERRGNGENMMKKHQEIQAKVIKELKLNADQTKKTQAAIAKRDAAMKKMRDQMEADRKAGKKMDGAESKKKWDAIQSTFDKEMKAAMGEKNYTTYQKRMREEMQKLRKENGAGPARATGGGGRPGGGGKAGGGN